MQEGAENLRKVARDKKSVSDVNTIVKKSNSKLTEMHQELQELESQILVSSQTPNAAGLLTLKIRFCLEKLKEYYSTSHFGKKIQTQADKALACS